MKKKQKNAIIYLITIIILLLSYMPCVSAEQTLPFDTVLVLDISGSMYSSLYDMCSSAKDLCKQIKDCNNENKISIIAFESEAFIACEMTDDINLVYDAIDNLYDGGVTAMYDALVLAYNTITSSESTHDIKNIIIMADGVPNEGMCEPNGRYDAMFPDLSISFNLGYENSVYNYAVANLHPIASVYTVGFFEFNSEDWGNLTSEQQLSVQLMKDLSNTNSFFPTTAEEMFSEVGGAIISDAETESSTQPETESEVISENITLAPVQNDSDSGMSTGTKIAIGAIATGSIGGLIALLIYLLSRAPKTPPVPIMTPAIIPVDDDEDEEKINDNYSAPGGIEDFAYNAGAVNIHEPFEPISSAVIFGVSGFYRDADFPINSDEVIRIGRDPKNCNIIIEDDVAKVSRVHCAVQYNESNNSFIVTDLSKNGTFTKASKLKYNVPTVLPRGTEIQLADSTNIFRLG